MDELLKNLGIVESVAPSVTAGSITMALLLSALLSAIVGLVYRRIHSDLGYSTALVHTIVLLSMITSLIMMIIGSNIARAFSLVGALSIIRFRTAIKSPLDVGFLFLGIAVGMACGTQFYLAAILGVLGISLVMFLLHVTRFGGAPSRTEFLLTLCFHSDVDHESVMAPTLKELFRVHATAHVETVRQGTQREVALSVSPRPGVTDKQVVDAMVKLNDNLKVSYRTVRHATDVP